jgi:hypothetical protein
VLYFYFVVITSFCHLCPRCEEYEVQVNEYEKNVCLKRVGGRILHNNEIETKSSSPRIIILLYICGLFYVAISNLTI